MRRRDHTSHFISPLHKVKSAKVRVALEKNTHTLRPGQEVRLALQRSVGLRAPPRRPGTVQPCLSQSREDRRERASRSSGRGRGRRLPRVPGSPRALHSVVRRHPLPQPAPVRSPPPPEASPAPSTPSLLFASSLLPTQPIVSQGTSRATCHTANWGGPLGGQPPGIGQLPAAPAPARLLFVTAAPVSPGAQREAKLPAARPGDAWPAASPAPPPTLSGPGTKSDQP